jgi:hypothetical protein
MLTFCALALGLLQAASPDAFSVQADLQGRYDEISQASLQFVNDTDIDDFHDVMYTSDWSVTDIEGRVEDWSQLRAQAVQALSAPRLDAIIQLLQRLALVPGGAIADVTRTTVRTVVDVEGRYGREKGATHTLNETTSYRDTWVIVGGAWKLKARRQLTLPRVRVDQPEYEPESTRKTPWRKFNSLSLQPSTGCEPIISRCLGSV